MKKSIEEKFKLSWPICPFLSIFTLVYIGISSDQLDGPDRGINNSRINPKKSQKFHQNPLTLLTMGGGHMAPRPLTKSLITQNWLGAF